MSILKLKRIHKGFYGNGNKYQFGNAVFIVSRYNSFLIFDQEKGTNSGQEIFRIYGKIDFNYGMSKFKEWLSKSEYINQKTIE